MKIKAAAYTVVSANNIDGLVEQVMQFIESGWVPLGGVALIAVTRFDREEVLYGQALVRMKIEIDG
jgi:hypothetical protein